MSKKVIVIGGGIIGLCSAYYLNKGGQQVTIVDQSNMDSGASYVNAGYLSPSHIIPLSAPGVMKKGLKWMWNNSSPLYIKPRADLDFIKWAWAFNKSCNQSHVDKSIPVIKSISLLSQELYDDIKENEKFNFHYEKKGLLMLCKSARALEAEIRTSQMANSEGLDTVVLNEKELRTFQPDVEIDALGAVLYKCDYHTTPAEFMKEMKAYLATAGVEFLKNEKVIDLNISGRRVSSIVTHKQTLKADEFVLATGSWSGLLAKKLRLNLLMQAGKGYRINTQKETGITVPAILTESKVAVTPMNGFTRFAGTMEIAGINNNINPVRVQAIANAVTKYYPNINLTKEEKGMAACGLRPLSPDGLPYIGKPSKWENIILASGHAMMGWSMGTATGKLVSEIAQDIKPSMDVLAFNPDRKF